MWEPRTMKTWRAYGVAVFAAAAWVGLISFIVSPWLDLPSGIESALIVFPIGLIVAIVTRALRREEAHDDYR